jgi:hypothetical protein
MELCILVGWRQNLHGVIPKRDLEIIAIKDRRRCSIDNRDDDTPKHAIVEHAKAAYGVRSKA